MGERNSTQPLQHLPPVNLLVEVRGRAGVVGEGLIVRLQVPAEATRSLLRIRKSLCSYLRGYIRSMTYQQWRSSNIHHQMESRGRS